MTTWGDTVRRIARQEGFVGPLSDTEVDYVLWERTAWPVDLSAHVHDQIRQFFAGRQEATDVDS